MCKRKIQHRKWYEHMITPRPRPRTRHLARQALLTTQHTVLHAVHPDHRNVRISLQLNFNQRAALGGRWVENLCLIPSTLQTSIID